MRLWLGEREITLIRSLCFLLLVILTAVHPSGSQQLQTALDAHALTAEQVVQNLVQMNVRRAQGLHAYQGTRTYRVDYRGFPGHRSAEMIVNVRYLAPGSKEFAIQSATGSKLIIDRVFKKLLEAEKEALESDNQRHTALNEENYRFTLVGYEPESSGGLFVLKVEPRTADKFLYRGRIWVDARDFAVVRLEAQPAKNPSFWTKQADIVQEYQKVGDFWLPVRNRSVTAIRLGGRAELTIEYRDYQITDASRITGITSPQAPPRSESARVQHK